jgi:hypothetical protein
MVKCEYKLKIHPHRDGMACFIDRRHCNYKGKPEECPVYYHFNHPEEQMDVVDIHLFSGKRDIRSHADIVINIQL